MIDPLLLGQFVIAVALCLAPGRVKRVMMARRRLAAAHRVLGRLAPPQRLTLPPAIGRERPAPRSYPSDGTPRLR